MVAQFNAVQATGYAVLPRFTADPPALPRARSRLAGGSTMSNIEHTLDMAANIKGAFAVASSTTRAE